MNPYRRRVRALVVDVLRSHGPLLRGLDVGAGDGWFAAELKEAGLISEIVAVDVNRRKRSFVDPILYDGRSLPFENREFSIVYGIDVVHHCDETNGMLKEMARCSADLLLLKDHTYRSRLGKLALCLMDEIGNRKFGIPSVYHYQNQWHWLEEIEAEGFALRQLIHPAPCHRGTMGWLTNGLQFVGLWQRA